MRRFPNVTSLDRKSNTQKKKKKNLETGFKSNFEYFQIFDFFFYFYVLQNVLSKVNVEEAKEIILYLSQGTVEVL